MQSSYMLKQLFSSGSDDLSVENMSNLLARVIFDSLEVPYDDEISTEIVKREIDRGNQDINLLLMLCFQNLDEEIEQDSDQEEEAMKRRKKKYLPTQYKKNPAYVSAVNDWENDLDEKE